MSRTERVLIAAFFVLSGLAACASPASPSIAACQNNEGCPAGARCTASACVDNSAPTARFTVTGTLEANAAVTLDASSSSDPDEGDSVEEYAWTVTRTTAECDAPTVASKTQQVSVVFGCAGTYEVSLSVKDEMQAESAPSKRSVVVTARTGPVLVEVGAPQTVEHTCGGTPLECRPATAIQLSATLPNPSFQNVRWTVLPPAGRELGGGRTVTFLPSANVPNPTVEVKTDGSAISGDWVFRVEVVDGQTVRDAALARVSINNRPPVITGGPPAEGFDHQYVASNQSYSAVGSFPVQVLDPDGDALTTRLTYQHTGDGEATFSAWPLPAEGTLSQIGFDVRARRSAELIAGGIQRTAIVAATDVNGGSGGATFAIVIGNQPPSRTLLADTAAAHSFDTPAYRYTSSPRLGHWTDPDGDPLDFDVTTQSEDCPAFTVDDAGDLRLLCEAGAPLSVFIRPGRTATVDVRDPWTTATFANITFGIGNRPPRIASQSTCGVSVSCRYLGGYCDPSAPISTGTHYGPGTGTATFNVVDDDHDPLELSRSGGPITTCVDGSTCSVPVSLPEARVCPTDSTVTLMYTASDGVRSTSVPLLVTRRCR